MSDYVPTTEEVYRRFWRGTPLRSEDKLREYVALDRWLTEHDREVKAQAIGDAIAYLKTTPAVTLTGKGGGYELLEAYRQGEEQ